MWAQFVPLADDPGAAAQANVWTFLGILATLLLGTNAVAKVRVRRHRSGDADDEQDPNEPVVREVTTRTIRATNDEFVEYLRERVEDLERQLAEAESRARREQMERQEVLEQLMTKRAQLHAVRNELMSLEAQMYRRPKPGPGDTHG